MKSSMSSKGIKVLMRTACVYRESIKRPHKRLKIQKEPHNTSPQKHENPIITKHDTTREPIKVTSELTAYYEISRKEKS